MAVVHMRIDNRLIHGQVTTTWVGNIGADYLVVTNDKVANDPVQKMLLPQAARGVPTKVLSIKDTLNFVKSAEAQKGKVMIVAKLPTDALTLLEDGLQPAEINVGNQAPVPGTKFKMVTHSIAVTAADAEVYRAIAAKGYTLTCKMMPSDRPTDFLEALKKNKL
ncbi:PTS mannose/fructose/sorbose transporter subunit IIB [Ktedonosporobacter rubrisoli]|uniref:PTS mannose/fructose/sorbose transporter subunit IIB n=1 Tax=Ktedonosporobacter rubrisoli TaxID=2509675 RepID=A0A4P6JR00_KTERU|nr:PTS sugar transporter subunit IIB [Ktedonosporobacter rubrisoli]QBD77775.1 PTS mannose/fructose/sorbose transporter subunit IIB [Ktedonosporobacter rubrisoli]